ncbi:hypothetical protein NKJ93_02375 [Mesorhizobium sp. M0028]|uniref:hypothetical protein n=1 Tax=unclassified Mesorhizobium TaxID=325217 RepID=UPI003336684D
MLRQLEYRIQLKDANTLEAIITAGGKAFVAVNGDALKATLKDVDGAALANPISLTRGFINFFTAETVLLVDLYIQAPGGQFIVVKNVKPSGPNEILVGTGRNQCMVIPWAAADITAATETATGFTVPSGLMLPTPFVNVTALDAAATIDVGTLSTDTGDADGYIDGLSVAAAALVKASVIATADTMGALFKVLDSANAGDDAPEGNVSMAGKSITVTTSAGADTGKGFIHLPYLLAA